MQRSNIALLPLIAVLMATAAWSLSTQASSPSQDDQPPTMSACSAEIEPAVVTAGAEVTLAVSFPSDPGEIVAVRTEEGSGIVVLGFHPTEVGLSAVTAQLDIPKAAAGAWWLEFDAGGETCRALLTVSEPAVDR